SSAARSASQKETPPNPPRIPLASLQNLPTLPLPRLGGGSKPSAGTAFALATGRERWFPLISHGTLFVLALVLPSTAPEALLALAALITLVNLQRRHGRFLKSVGWALLLVVVGLGLSQALLAALPSTLWSVFPLQPYQLQAAFAVLVQLLGALFIA
ncbi:MAG: CPP1-like family protein, partial [Cyanobacteriota bacterium]